MSEIEAKLMIKLMLGAWIISYGVAIATMGAPHIGQFDEWVLSAISDALAMSVLYAAWMWFAIAVAHIPKAEELQ